MEHFGVSSSEWGIWMVTRSIVFFWRGDALPFSNVWHRTPRGTLQVILFYWLLFLLSSSDYRWPIESRVKFPGSSPVASILFIFLKASDARYMLCLAKAELYSSFRKKKYMSKKLFYSNFKIWDILSCIVYIFIFNYC